MTPKWDDPRNGPVAPPKLASQGRPETGEVTRHNGVPVSWVQVTDLVTWDIYRYLQGGAPVR